MTTVITDNATVYLKSGRAVSVRLSYERRKTILFSIKNDVISIKAPFHLSEEKIHTALIKKSKCIEQAIEQQKIEKENQVIWGIGQTIPLFGKRYTLYLCPLSPRICLRDNKIIIPYSSLHKKSLRETVIEWMKSWGLSLFQEKCKNIAQQLNILNYTIKLSSAKGCWGNCNHQRVIRINWLLITLDQELIDYVLAHEMAHCLEMNHSNKFWDIVLSVESEALSLRKKLNTICMPTL